MHHISFDMNLFINIPTHKEQKDRQNILFLVSYNNYPIDFHVIFIMINTTAIYIVRYDIS